MMRKLFLAVATIFLGACSSTSSQYYEAVQKAAEANAAATQAKFEALSKIAASGDGQAASAAVMALALTQTPVVQPLPQQSEALQWASILATPVTSLGMMWMQSDSAKKMAEYNKDVSLARVAATSADNQALYGAFVGANQITGDVAVAGLNAAGNVDYSDFINGMVTLGTAGINGAVDLGTAGFASNVEIADAGLNATVALGTAGLNTAENLGVAGLNTAQLLGVAGMTNLTQLGTVGISTTGAVGVAGMANLTSLGVSGMENMLNMSADYNGLLSSTNSGWLDYVGSRDALDASSLISTQTSYQEILERFLFTLDSYGMMLDYSPSCQDVGGTIVCL